MCKIFNRLNSSEKLKCQQQSVGMCIRCPDIFLFKTILKDTKYQGAWTIFKDDLFAVG